MFSKIPSLLVAVAVFCGAGARADVLYLQNGDRISGTLIGIGEDALRFQGAYTEVFGVPRGDVLAVTTDEEVELVLRDSGAMTGRLILVDEQQGLGAEGEAKPIALDEVISVAVPGVEIQIAEAQSASGETPPAAEPDEAAGQEAAPKKWSGNVTAGATWHRGATDTFDAAAGVTVVRTWPQDTLTLKSEAGYGEVESEKNTQRILGELKWQHYWNERFYSYWLGGAEHDPARQLDLRLRTNVGLGREFINNERRKLSLEAGVGYRREYWLEYGLVEERQAEKASEQALRARLTQFLNEIGTGIAGLELIEASLRYIRDVDTLTFDNDTTSEDSVNVHASSHYEQQVFTRSMVSSDLTFEPDIDDISNFRALSDLAFLTPLSEKMSLKIRLNSEYDSDPGDTTAENWEHKFVTGLEYKF